MDNNLHNFKTHPEKEYPEGLSGSASAILGQPFLEESDNLPENSTKYDYWAQVTITVTAEEHAKSVINNFKGLSAMFLMIPEIKNLGVKDGIKFTFLNEGVNVISEVGISDAWLEALLKHPTINIVEKLGCHGYRINAGGMLGFNPVDLLTKDALDVIETAFDISLNGGGDELVRWAMKEFLDNLRKQAESKQDIIADRLALPICNFLKDYVEGSDKIEFDHTYDRDYLKNAIYDYNLQYGSFQREKEELAKMQEKVRSFLETDLKKFSEGFFGAYLKVLHAINFNSLELLVVSHFRCAKASGKISCPGVSEYIRDNVLCYLKK